MNKGECFSDWLKFNHVELSSSVPSHLLAYVLMAVYFIDHNLEFKDVQYNQSWSLFMFSPFWDEEGS